MHVFSIKFSICKLSEISTMIINNFKNYFYLNVVGLFLFILVMFMNKYISPKKCEQVVRSYAIVSRSTEPPTPPVYKGSPPQIHEEASNTSG